MSNQILDRSMFVVGTILTCAAYRVSIVSQMSSRVDALENSIHDLINGDIARPATPSTPGNFNPRRHGSSDSGL